MFRVSQLLIIHYDKQTVYTRVKSNQTVNVRVKSDQTVYARVKSDQTE